MGESVVFLVIFDTCDVVYNWSISLLPTIVLNNLFGGAFFRNYDRSKKGAVNEVTSDPSYMEWYV